MTADFANPLPDPPIPEGRSCGACTFCCKVMEIRELAKPAGSHCPNCVAGKGCGVYETRPASCRAYACLWLVDASMSHALRPDRAKVLFDLDGGRRLTARCDPANPLAWKRAPVYPRLKQWATSSWDRAFEIVALAGRRMWVITPWEDIDMGEIDLDSPYRIERGRARGQTRVTMLPPLQARP